MSKRSNEHARVWLIAIIAAHVILCAAYSHFTPWGAPPDEGPHGLYVMALANTHSLPVFNVRDTNEYENHQPPLYYILAVPFFAAGKGMAVRWLSTILGALSILVIFRAVRMIYPNDPGLAIGTSGFAALIPTHVMVSSSVGNDVLLELLFGVALLLCASVVVKGASVRRTVLIGTVLGLAALTKTTGLMLIPIAVLAYVFARPKAIPLHLAGMLVVTAAISGWWFVRNQVLYGDPLAMNAFKQAFAHTATPEYWLSNGFALWQYWVLVMAWTFCSFWGVFGHMKVFMPAWTYVALLVVLVPIKIGAIRSWHADSRASSERRSILILYDALIALVAIGFVAFNASFFQAQGRYLYPAILCMSLMWAMGIRNLTPKRVSAWSPVIAVGIPALVQLIALVTCIVPRMPNYQ